MNEHFPGERNSAMSRERLLNKPLLAVLIQDFYSVKLADQVEDHKEFERLRTFPEHGDSTCATGYLLGGNFPRGTLSRIGIERSDRHG
jgi:hypothetical protein